MGRAPCCEKDSVKRGPWTPEEDAKLLACVAQHGTGSWRTLPKKAGLQRCGKSCRLRWTNYLRPDLKHGRFSDHEEQTIVKLHAALGSRWSLIAAQLPGRTDNDVKNYWNTRLKKKLCEMGIDPITHKPISQLLADLAGSMGAMGPVLQQTTSSGSMHGAITGNGRTIADAALGCFKDDMLNVIMRRNPSTSMPSTPLGSPMSATPLGSPPMSATPLGSPRPTSSVPGGLPPGAGSSTSSPTAGNVFDRPQLQPFMKIPPFLQMSSKFVSQMSHSLSQANTSNAVGGAGGGGGGGDGLIGTRSAPPASLLPPYLRFLNPPPTPSPLATAGPFHPFLRASTPHLRPFSNSFSRQQDEPPSVKSMMDVLVDARAVSSSSSTSTLISGVMPKRFNISSEEASSLHVQLGTTHMEHNYLAPNRSTISSDAGDKFLTSQADLQAHIAEPHPWFSNAQEEQHVDKDDQTHESSMFNWENNEEGNHNSSNYYVKSKGDNNVIPWSPTCTSRSSSTCSNLPGALDLSTHHHSSSNNIIEQNLLTSVDTILWDLSDLNAFIS